MNNLELSYPAIDPVAIQIGPLAIHWYGLMYLFGFACAWFLAMHRAKAAHSVINRQQVESLITYGAFGVILGGRAGYVLFYHFSYWLTDPLWLFRIWEGGMSFHGGLVGVTIAVWLYARRIRQPFIAVTDFAAPLVPLGLGFGRLGNFIGGELWGRVSDVPWAMVFPSDPSGLPRHPSQLYQAVTEGVVLFALVFWFSMKPRARGAVTGMFLVGYGALRIFTEFFRAPDEHIEFDLFGWVTRGQLLSVPLVLLGAGLLIYAWRSRVKRRRA